MTYKNSVKNLINSTTYKKKSSINPLVPRVQKIKIRQLNVNWLLIANLATKSIYLNAHYSERQGLMG